MSSILLVTEVWGGYKIYKILKSTFLIFFMEAEISKHMFP